MFLVDEEPHEFRDRQGGVRIVDVNGHFISQLAKVRLQFFETAQDALNAGGNEEIFLNKPQTAAFVGAVVRIEELRNALHRPLILLPVVPPPLGGNPVSGKIPIHFRVPEAQSIDGMIFRPHNGDIVRHSQNGGISFMYQFQGTVVLFPHVSITAETHVYRLVRLAVLPRKAVPQPPIGQLHLMTVNDFLFEETVFIADTAPVGGQRQRCHGVNEAGRQAAQPAVAEAGVRLLVVKLRQREVQPL